MKKWLPVYVLAAVLALFLSEPVWSQAVRPLVVSFNGTAQPVSGTVTVTQGTASSLKVDLSGTAANSTALKVDGSAVTQPVSGTVSANIGTTNGLALDATLTGRLPAGASPASAETNTNTNLSRIGTYPFIYNGATWDRWTGAVSQTGSWTVTANAGTNLNTSALATEATLDARTGALTETAPASDTASSGLNGRLQRVAQRLTSLIALFPTALTGSGNFKAAIVENTASIPTGANTIGAVTQASGPWTQNITQFGGTNVATGTGTGGAGIPRVTVSSDSSLTANQGTAGAASARWPVYLSDGSNPQGSDGNPLKVNFPTGSNGSVYVNGYNGSNTDGFGNGYAGTSTQRVAVAKDSGLLAPNGTDALLQKILDTLNQKGTPKDAMSLKAGAFGKVVGPGNPLNVVLPDAPDPCTKRKGNVAISQTATSKQVPGIPGQLIAACYVRLVAGAAEIVALTEGTNTNCGAGTLAVSGSTTAANGESYAANGGFSAGTGAAMVATTVKTGDDLCVQQSGANRVSGQLLYVYYTP